MLSFNYCKTFFMDASLVGGATEVAITKIDLYFRAKPQATDNKSGIEYPGVEVMILPTRQGLPVINQIGAYRPTEPTEHGAKFAFYSGGQVSRKEWGEIIPSIDGSIATSFLLDSPAFVRTNQEYAIVVKFDGNESFRLWENKVGDWLVGSTTVSPGPSNQFDGSLYKFVSNPNAPTPTSGYGYTNNDIVAETSSDPALLYTSHSNIGLDVWDGNYLMGSWHSIPGTTIKYNVYVARYSYSGIPAISNSSVIANSQHTTAMDRSYVFNRPDSVLSNNVIRLISPCEPQEYILFERENSRRNELFYGETVFQSTPQWPGGTATPLTLTCAPTGDISHLVDLSNVDNVPEYKKLIVIANNNYVLPNLDTFGEAGGFNRFLRKGDRITITSANGDYHFVRGVADILANNILLVNMPFNELLTDATVSISPVAYIGDISPSYILGQNKDVMILYDSFVTPSVRFISDAVDSIEIVSGGSGYSNSDYIRISGYEDLDYGIKGNYPAYANIVTNSSGNITNIYVSNQGSGFVNTSWLTGSNITFLTSANGIASNTLSTGTGANVQINVGSNLLSEFSQSKFANCKVINLDAVRMKPEITVNNPVGSVFTIKHRTLFYKTANPAAQNGWSYFVNTPQEQEATDTYAKIFKSHDLIASPNKIPVIPSRSNQMVIRYANGEQTTPEIIGGIFSNSAIFVFDISSNNDFQACYFDPEIVNSHYSHYIINREFTNEHTQFGKAWAKHITAKINMDKDRSAEDVLVYLTAYRPVGTEFKVYAKIHNSDDPEEFDDKDWTLLDQIDGNGVYSSRDDSSDFIELTYNLPSYPNTEHVMNGSAVVEAGSARVVGSNTQFGALFTISNGGSGYANGDQIFVSPTPDTAPATGFFALNPKKRAKGTITTDGSGAITSIQITASGTGFNNQTPTSNVWFANSTGGSSTGNGASISFRPGLIQNDLIKIYSPYFPETNYYVAVVNNVVNDTLLEIKHELGDLSANSIGTVSVNTTHLTITGNNTNFGTTFIPGDFIAVWSNTDVYEVRKIASIVSNTSLAIEGPNFTFANNASNYAYVNLNAFVNNSITVDGLKIDKLHYEHQAFNNIMNDNVARYYSSNMSVYDSFNTAQIKVVMLSESELIVPKVDDVRFVAVSA